MSGSPAWVIRASEHQGIALDASYVRETNKDELKLDAFFAGLVVEHLEQSQKLVIIKPSLCADFAKVAEQRMCELRNPKED